MAVHPEVRAALLDLQRDFAARAAGAVIDGRDIGTVIAPDAPAKLFVTAAGDPRRAPLAPARRPGRGGGLEEVLADIRLPRRSATAAAPTRPWSAPPTPSCSTPPK